MEPDSARRRVATTSRPTPRPEISVTASRVEKPGSSVRRAISASVGVASASSRPRSTALAADVGEIQSAAVVGDLHGDDLAAARDGQRDACRRAACPRPRARRAIRVRGRRRCAGCAAAGRSTGSTRRRRPGCRWPTTTSEACLWVAAAVWRTLRCRRGTMVSTGAMRVCEVRCCSSRMRRCCWCRMPARPASSSLRPTPEVARVGGFFDQRARERLHFVVLVHFQRVEIGVRVHDVQLVARLRRRGCRRNVSSSNRRFWMARSLLDRARANGRPRISVPARARRS